MLAVLGNRAQCYAELSVSSQRWPKQSPVLSAPNHRGNASGLYTYQDGRPTKANQSQY